MPKSEPVTLRFTRENETKNKMRFQEDDVDEKVGPVVDKLYISKKHLKKMGDPDVLIVHISAP